MRLLKNYLILIGDPEMKIKVVVFGSTGMLGHEVERVLKNESFDVTLVNRNKIDAQCSSTKDVQASISGYDWVINCVGLIRTHINSQSSLSVRQAIQVNGLFPHKLAEAAENVNAKVIQIATDCVFDGQKGNYTETDLHNATDVYGKTKSLGEVCAKNFMNLRCSIIGRELKNKTSLLEWFLNQPANAVISGYKNHLWNGVTTTAFAKICVGIMRNNLFINNMQHIIPADAVSKSDMLNLFKKIFNRRDIIIEDICTDIGINRTLSTHNFEMNKNIWNAAMYKQIPTIEEMCKEMNIG
jgi:dTDP-4-dehydrorhamnose reductase